MNLSVSLPLDSSPKVGALGKEVSFRSNTRCCDKTSPPQSLPCQGRWHAAGVTERFGPHRLPKPPSPYQGRWHGEAVTERLYRAAPALFRSL